MTIVHVNYNSYIMNEKFSYTHKKHGQYSRYLFKDKHNFHFKTKISHKKK